MRFHGVCVQTMLYYQFDEKSIELLRWRLWEQRTHGCNFSRSKREEDEPVNNNNNNKKLEQHYDKYRYVGVSAESGGGSNLDTTSMMATTWDKCR